MNGWWILVLIYLVGLLIGVASTFASTSYLESEHSAQDDVGPFASLRIMVWPILLGINIVMFVIYFCKKLMTEKTVKTDNEYQAH